MRLGQAKLTKKLFLKNGIGAERYSRSEENFSNTHNNSNFWYQMLYSVLCSECRLTKRYNGASLLYNSHPYFCYYREVGLLLISQYRGVSQFQCIGTCNFKAEICFLCSLAGAIASAEIAP